MTACVPAKEAMSSTHRTGNPPSGWRHRWRSRFSDKTDDLELSYVGKGIGEHERVWRRAEDEQGMGFHAVG